MEANGPCGKFDDNCWESFFTHIFMRNGGDEGDEGDHDDDDGEEEP